MTEPILTSVKSELEAKRIGQDFESDEYWIDTHCHFDMLTQTAEAVIAAAKDCRVRQMITISVEPTSFNKVLNFCQKYPQLYGSLGVHPHDATQFNDQVEADLRQALRQQSKIIAIGETGLDYHYMHSSKKEQKSAFTRQLEIAASVNLPVVLHTREAEEDTLAILREFNPSCKGVAHSFTSSLKMAEELLEMGWYLGFNGIVTFPKAEAVREVVRHTPLQRLLIETDAPYLTPVPFRGRPNDSTRIPIIGHYIAQMLSMPASKFANQTTENAINLFKLEPAA